MGDKYNCTGDGDCKSCEKFLSCQLEPHMKRFSENNEDPAYIHIQLTYDGEDENCVMYAGEAKSILSAVSILLENLAEEVNADYYDVVAAMATARAQKIKEEYDNYERSDYGDYEDEEN